MIRRCIHFVDSCQIYGFANVVAIVYYTCYIVGQAISVLLQRDTADNVTEFAFH